MRGKYLIRIALASFRITGADVKYTMNLIAEFNLC